MGLCYNFVILTNQFEGRPVPLLLFLSISLYSWLSGTDTIIYFERMLWSFFSLRLIAGHLYHKPLGT